MRLVAIAFWLFLAIQIKAQLVTNGPNDLDHLLEKADRPVMVFIHADWCKFCNMMKHTTWKDAEVIRSLNASWYFVSMNAETKETIRVNGRDFSFKPNGDSGKHELALELGGMDGKLTLPALTLLNSKGEIIFQQSGFLSAEELIDLLSAYN